MIRFEHSYYLYGLLLIPLFYFLFLMMLRWKRRALKKIGESSVINKLMPDVSRSKPALKFLLLMLAYAFLVIGIANPQSGSKLVKIKRKGIDLMICLDVSNSMLAQDITPNRLERAKQAISDLIDKLHNDRIGIVVFAGKAYLQLPITTDYSAAKLFLSNISTDIVPVQGTDIGDAIDLASESFDNNKHSKAIVIITDGENNEGNAIKQAQKSAEKGINIYTIGMGLPEGAPIPVYNKYNTQIGYKKDRQGNTIITKLNETMLQQIASAGNGTYVRANNSKLGLRKIYNKINKLNKSEIESKMFSEYENHFQYFIGASIFFLLIELLIFERKSKWSGKIKLFER